MKLNNKNNKNLMKHLIKRKEKITNQSKKYKKKEKYYMKKIFKKKKINAIKIILKFSKTSLMVSITNQNCKMKR
jgi:hypothetical protein